MKSFIVEYYDAIERGEILVGRPIDEVLERLLGYIEDGEVIFDPKRAHARMEFQEKYCLQGKKPYYKKPIALMLWQKAIWEAAYGFYDKATRFRLINELFIEVARKNGKSTMVAADINTDLFIGEGGVEICCASNIDKQAKYIWGEVNGMRKRLDPKNLVTSNNLSEIRNDDDDIKIVRMSDRTENKDGGNFVKFVHDEAWEGKDAELPEAGERSMSTHDEYLLITVSTNGFINGGYYDKKLKYARQWLAGEIDNPHYLPFLYEQDDERECWGDLRILQKSNPSLMYGVKKLSFLEQSRSKALVDRESRLHFLTKDCNVKISDAQAWLDLDDYDYPQEVKTLEDFRGCVAVGAVDLSDCGDLTVAKVLLMRKGDDTKYIFTKYFIPESKLEDKDNGAKYKEWSQTINPADGEPYIRVCKGVKIDQTEVAAWLFSLQKKYNIWVMCTGYDRWHSDVFLLRMGKKEGYGMETVSIAQHPKAMSYPMKTVERDLKARLINYGGNPVDKMCFANTSAKIVNDRIMAEKIGGEYARKIDGTVCLIILYATLEKNESKFMERLR